jgi:adenylylsulfate kinase/chloramphenicol 3-O phosphotransferase
MKGPVIYLNGVTSSGKSTIVEALRTAGLDFYYLSDDIFEDHIVGIDYDAPGYWNTLAEAVFLMHKTARLFSDHGKTVVIDSMLLETDAFAPHYRRILDIYKDHPLYMVEVFCPLEICRQRNLLRGDRHEMQSHEQAAVMASHVTYNLHLDTSQLSSNQCAAEIVHMLTSQKGVRI